MKPLKVEKYKGNFLVEGTSEFTIKKGDILSDGNKRWKVIKFYNMQDGISKSTDYYHLVLEPTTDKIMPEKNKRLFKC